MISNENLDYDHRFSIGKCHKMQDRMSKLLDEAALRDGGDMRVTVVGRKEFKISMEVHNSVLTNKSRFFIKKLGCNIGSKKGVRNSQRVLGLYGEKAMGVFTFVLRKSGDEWTAKQYSGDIDVDIEESFASTFEIQRKLVNAALAVDSSGAVQSSFSHVSPSSAVFQVIVGGAVLVGGGVAAAAVPAGGAAPAGEAPAAEKKEETVEEEEEDDDDLGLSLFD
ncbi:hypothetical protein VNO77_44086 [Canavalia gladiata]|uniref:60S acidic ribosomal protein P3 n=1 Tax=Canavalia gladiata TaxID=3824 RepID=A0AAN9JXM1_CANGL